MEEENQFNKLLGNKQDEFPTLISNVPEDKFSFLDYKKFTENTIKRIENLEENVRVLTRILDSIPKDISDIAYETNKKFFNSQTEEIDKVLFSKIKIKLFNWVVVNIKGKKMREIN